MTTLLCFSIAIFLTGLSHCFISDSQFGVIVLCTGLFLAILNWLKVIEKCGECGLEYNSLGNSHCCQCKKVYVNAIYDANGSVLTYMHCCKCNDEYNDIWDNHNCPK